MLLLICLAAVKSTSFFIDLQPDLCVGTRASKSTPIKRNLINILFQSYTRNNTYSLGAGSLLPYRVCNQATTKFSFRIYDLGEA